MTRTIELLLISLSVLLTLIAARSIPFPCSEGKEYDECGSTLPANCDDLETICIQECVPGCICKKGTVDNGFGKCVEKKTDEVFIGNRTHNSCSTCIPTRDRACLAVCNVRT